MLGQNNLFPLKLPKVKNLMHCTCPEDFANLIMEDMRWLPHEEFWAIALNSRNHIIAKDMITKGSLTGCVVHPREIYKFAILNNAAAIVVAHNHPSGNSQPSPEDNKITTQLYHAGEILSIPLLDHIIIGNGEYYSYQENNKLEDYAKTI